MVRHPNILMPLALHRKPPALCHSWRGTANCEGLSSTVKQFWFEMLMGFKHYVGMNMVEGMLHLFLVLCLIQKIWNISSWEHKQSEPCLFECTLPRRTNLPGSLNQEILHCFWQIFRKDLNVCFFLVAQQPPVFSYKIYKPQSPMCKTDL